MIVIYTLGIFTSLQNAVLRRWITPTKDASMKGILSLEKNDKIHYNR